MRVNSFLRLILTLFLLFNLLMLINIYPLLLPSYLKQPLNISFMLIMLIFSMSMFILLSIVAIPTVKRTIIFTKKLFLNFFSTGCKNNTRNVKVDFEYLYRNLLNIFLNYTVKNFLWVLCLAVLFLIPFFIYMDEYIPTLINELLGYAIIFSIVYMPTSYSLRILESSNKIERIFNITFVILLLLTIGLIYFNLLLDNIHYLQFNIVLFSLMAFCIPVFIFIKGLIDLSNKDWLAFVLALIAFMVSEFYMLFIFGLYNLPLDPLNPVPGNKGTHLLYLT